MWKTQKIFETLTPFTLLDFENTPSSILWFSGCNMRCGFCYNPEIVHGVGEFSFEDLESFFETRQNLLQGVVLCGGEPTINKQLIEITKQLKKLGYKIKLDTNGLKPDIIKILVEQKLIDFIALDFKAPKEKFTVVTKCSLKEYENFLKTLQFLIKNHFPFEVRTTFCDRLLELTDIETMTETLAVHNYKGVYALQNFIASKETIGKINNQNKINLEYTLKDKIKTPFSIKFRNF